jgi:hypothetical protein
VPRSLQRHGGSAQVSELPYRPEGFRGSVEDHLPRISHALLHALTKAQKEARRATLKLPRAALKVLTETLVEFAEDLHCGLGIWCSFEGCNREFFGTPLPFISEPAAALPSDAISPGRVRHLLWILYPQLVNDLILSPDHVDLLRMADVGSDVLQNQFAGLRKASGVKTFLETPNHFGWEVKRKLIWIGTKSYLFRQLFQNYARDKVSSTQKIDLTDDFLCQECTEWAGLGALEILAGALALPPKQRADLLSWSQRHFALFRVVLGNEELLKVVNLVNDAKYQVRMNMPQNPFRTGTFVLGSLVPWGGEWYWSGQQRAWEHLDSEAIEQLREGFRARSSIYFRYSPAPLQKAREAMRRQYDEFVNYHGRDWVVFPDGRAVADEMQKMWRKTFDARPAVEQQQFLERYGLEQPALKIDFPPELLKSDHGIGVYFNREDGQQIVRDFNDISAGLEKKGVELVRGRGRGHPGTRPKPGDQSRIRPASSRDVRQRVDQGCLPA